MKRYRILASALILLLTVTASSCSAGNTQSLPSNLPASPSNESSLHPEGNFGSRPPQHGEETIPSGNNTPVSIESVTTALPETPVMGETSVGADEEYAAVVTLEGAGATVKGDGVTVDGGTVTVTKAGKYLVSGSLTGQLRVDTAEEEEVVLLFNGVSIVGDKNAAVYILSAPKRVTILTVAGSKNILTDAQSYQYDGETEEPSACLYAKDDLRLEGEGELYVSSSTMKGIYSKDDLKILSGSIQVTSGDDGIRGKDSLTIAGGSITVISGTDALKASGDPTEEQGIFLMNGGTVHLEAKDDGIDAAGKLSVLGGSLEIRTGEGSAANNSSGGNDFGGGGRPDGGWGWRPGGNDSNQQPDNSEGLGGKGIKSDTEILLSGGTIKIDSYDDAVHATNHISFTGGELTASAGDDGVHCDKNIDISEGILTITGSYEGIEGQYITVSGGKVYVTARDDGFNATDGSSSGGMGGRPGGFGGSGQDALVTISGGYVVMNANGDGMDSNGDVRQTGGTVIVFGPSNNGNGAIDTGDGRENGYFFEGGSLLAIGSSGMAESPEQGDFPVLSTRTSTISASSNVYILDENGNCVVAFTTPKSISSIVFTSSALKSGKLTIYAGGTLPELTDGVAFFPSEAPSGGKSIGSVNV